ncbi:hypothetical protein FCV25MIE_16172 [Fagus crenata]
MFKRRHCRSYGFLYARQRWWRRKAGVVDKRWCEDEVVSKRWCEMGLLASGDVRWGCRRALVPTSSVVNSANSWNLVKVKEDRRSENDQILHVEDIDSGNVPKRLDEFVTLG